MSKVPIYPEYIGEYVTPDESNDTKRYWVRTTMLDGREAHVTIPGNGLAKGGMAPLVFEAFDDLLRA